MKSSRLSQVDRIVASALRLIGNGAELDHPYVRWLIAFQNQAAAFSSRVPPGNVGEVFTKLNGLERACPSSGPIELHQSRLGDAVRALAILIKRALVADLWEHTAPTSWYAEFSRDEFIDARRYAMRYVSRSLRAIAR